MDQLWNGNDQVRISGISPAFYVISFHLHNIAPKWVSQEERLRQGVKIFNDYCTYNYIL